MRKELPPFNYELRIVLLLFMLTLAGCQAGGYAGTSAPLPNPPAVAEPTASPQKSAGVPSDWLSTTRTVSGVTYTLSRPPDWSEDLSFCINKPTGDAAKGPGLPAGCAVTDLLVGRKASDLGQLAGDSLTTLDGKRGVKQIDKQPPSHMAARIYTFLVYDTQNNPLFGFSTSIGVGTPQADQDSITQTLDAIASTVTVEK